MPGRDPRHGRRGLSSESAIDSPQPRRAEARLGIDFFARSVHTVARELIGCRLFFGGVGGTIVETESYEENDPACHAHVGFTKRTSVLFGPPGRTYVYLSYGIHSLLNVVCEPDGVAAAVLVRALEPTAGLEAMRERRPAARSDADLCNGPGKLTEAIGVNLADHDKPIDRDPFLILKNDGPPLEVVTGPRIGITKAIDYPWRFSAAGNRWVSRPKPPSDAGARTRDRRSS